MTDHDYTAEQVDDLRFRASGAIAEADRLERESRAAKILALSVELAELEGSATTEQLDKAHGAARELQDKAMVAWGDAYRLKSEAEAALAEYLRRWESGMAAPFGYQECRGRRPDGSYGPHLRRTVPRPMEVARGDVLIDSRYLPLPPIAVELAENERAEYTVADQRPVIIEVPSWR